VVKNVVGTPEELTVVNVVVPTALVVDVSTDAELVVGVGNSVGRSTDRDTEMEINGSREDVLLDEI